VGDQRAKLLVSFPQFRVADVVRTAEYYRDILGFEIGDYFGDPPVFTHISRDYVVIQIGLEQPGGTPTRPPGGIGHNAYIWTDDVDALAAELKERGAEILEGPVERQYHCREIIVRDCNGLILCFAKRRTG
jgi:catechol 2,3-dioxygenase-like lactoylglutathione lyase family enzyme